MDPFTMCLLIGVFLSVGGRSVANGVTDAIAMAMGKTPPSHEKWQKKQAERKARGEKPEKKPGLLRLWVRHAAETKAAKAQAKQRGRLKFLEEHGDKIAAKQKEKLERSVARRELVGQKLAKAADVSWNAAKDGATKAKDKVTRNRAADETRTDKPGEGKTEADTGAEPAAETTKAATVLPFRRTSDPATASDGDEKSANPAPAVPQQPVPRATPAPAEEERASRNYLACRWGAHNPETKCKNRTVPGKNFCAEHQDLAEPARTAPESAPRDSGTGGAAAVLPGPTTSSPKVHVPSAGDTSTSPSSENEGESMAPANTTTEITSLDTAIAFGEDSAKYTSTVSSEMADMPALLTTFATGCEAEAKAYENASSQVEGAFSSDSKAKAQFAAAAEALNEAAKVLRTASANVGEAAEKATVANSAMKTLVKFFTDKLGTREVINAEKANGGAAKTTAWYTD